VTSFFPKAHFVRDRYHVVEAFKTKITISRWPKFQDDVMSMIQAESEEKFDHALQNLITTCGDHKDLVNYFNNQALLKRCFVNYERNMKEIRI